MWVVGVGVGVGGEGRWVGDRLIVWVGGYGWVIGCGWVGVYGWVIECVDGWGWG